MEQEEYDVIGENKISSLRAWQPGIMVTACLVSLSMPCLSISIAAELSQPIADGSVDGAATLTPVPTAIEEVHPPWPARPLMDGDWQDLSPDQFSAVMQKLRSHRDALSPNLIRRNEWPVLVEPSRLRRLPLACYNNVALIEAEIQETGEQPGVLTFLLHEQGGTLLNGRRGVEQIRLLNKWNPPQLNTPEQAVTYLKFVIGAMDPGDGNFRVLEEAHSVDWKTDADRAAHADLEQVIRPLEIRKNGDSWIGVAIIQYKADLYRAELALSPDGLPKMLDDQSLGSNLPIKVRRFIEWLRYDAL